MCNPKLAKEHRRSGAALVEYALLLSLIAAVCLAVVTKFGSKVSSMFQDADNKLVLDGSNNNSGGNNSGGNNSGGNNSGGNNSGGNNSGGNKPP